MHIHIGFRIQHIKLYKGKTFSVESDVGILSTGTQSTEAGVYVGILLTALQSIETTYMLGHKNQCNTENHTVTSLYSCAVQNWMWFLVLHWFMSVVLGVIVFLCLIYQ